jgi:hypothetical protein
MIHKYGSENIRNGKIQQNVRELFGVPLYCTKTIVMSYKHAVQE